MKNQQQLNKNRNINREFSGSWFSWRLQIYKIITFLAITTFFLLGVTRFSIVGQSFDDVLRLIFGWTKYFIYLLPLLIIIVKKNRAGKPISKKTVLKMIWISFNLYWTFGLIGAIMWNVEQNQALEYSAYGIDKLVPNFVNNWYENSIYPYYNQIVDVKDFFSYHQYFSRSFDSGGVLGITIASLSSYLSIFGGSLLNIFIWFLAISYLLHNYVWFYFLRYEQRSKIRWKNLNENKKFRIQTNIIDEIEDQDITIELQTAKKIQIQDENNDATNINQINKGHLQLVKGKAKEEVQTAKIDLGHNDNDRSSTDNNTDWEKPDEDKTFIDWIDTNETGEIDEKKKEENEFLVEPTVKSGMPSATLFSNLNEDREKEKILINQNQAKSNGNKIYQVFTQYRVEATIHNWQVGPQVTRYEIHLKMGTKVQKVLELEKELKLILGEERLRFETPIPGQSQAVGIEVPNPYVTLVNWKEIAKTIIQNSNQLFLGIGKNLTGGVEKISLNGLPHLLVAGSTGGGKTMCLLAIICSLIYQQSPDNLKLLLIDPKRVELAIFNEIPHLITPVITDTNLVANALDKIIAEINKRFQIFRDEEVVNIDEFNVKVEINKKMPKIVLIVDELADLILTYQKNIENKIVKIGQIGRAAGVFMVVATQRPSVDIITSLIKTNLPGRIAFRVPSHNDSRTILNFGGAEQLTGQGDMLYVQSGAKPKRIQGTWIERRDINELVQFWKKQNYQDYFWKEFNSPLQKEAEDQNDFLYKEVKLYVQSLEQVSISLLQRRFNLGFNRAAKLFDRLEAENIIVPNNNDNKARRVIKQETTKN